ncbi:killer cell lectin-like receptor subfamily B member 1C isoform 3-T3 [Anomaloglossus baeobatrachus]|uniref:killer cell lectin-like receptor subfamily B member 1C isoform X3 n=1 Tax=Anomaloglossus baeobatrachus TaxID=238106 RepID=UPI003F50D0C8
MMTKEKTGVYHSLPPGDTLLKIDSVDQRYCRCERLLIVGLILVIIGLTSALIIVRTRPSSCDLNNEEYEHNIDKSAPCEDDWMWHRGKCYYFSTESDTWNNSEKFCNSHGATLAIIDNKEELIQHHKIISELWRNGTCFPASGRCTESGGNYWPTLDM